MEPHAIIGLVTAQHFSDGPASARASEEGGEAAPGDE